ncbi:hypothetical protein [Marinobacter gelidimuriae]|uniref:hypothetical protein n=1 Tax=Marinobacter gelidimuriae TaxID=2739064 RepID=UPI0003A3566D|nr:hypothetical protein [Marinobacter gelidimuriae]
MKAEKCSRPVRMCEPAFMAMEDREANQLGLTVGDRVEFQAEGQTIAAEIKALYQQKGLQTRFWFEGVLQDGALVAGAVSSLALLLREG